jgi:hypothetical protein
MLCLMGKPSKLPASQFPGAQSRYDDFVVVHINQTMSIHGTVCYLFHRPQGGAANLFSGQLPVLAPLFHVGDGECSQNGMRVYWNAAGMISLEPPC